MPRPRVARPILPKILPNGVEARARKARGGVRNRARFRSRRGKGACPQRRASAGCACRSARSNPNANPNPNPTAPNPNHDPNQVRLSLPSGDTASGEATGQAGQGAEAAAARSEAAVSLLRDLSRRLRQRDPESRVEAAPDGATGRFVINSVLYNSRLLRWVGKVDGDTDVFALQHMIQRSLAACC